MLVLFVPPLFFNLRGTSLAATSANLCITKTLKLIFWLLFLQTQTPQFIILLNSLALCGTYQLWLPGTSFPTKYTRGKFGASVYGSCKHSSLVSMRMIGSTWICLNFILLDSKDFANFQIYHCQQNIAL